MNPISELKHLHTDNMNLLIISDDFVFFNFLINSLRKKGMKIVDFPTFVDSSSIVPFILLNEHSILVVRNPSNEILAILKQIIKNKTVQFSQGKKSIKVNNTIWILIDPIPLIEKQKPKGN